MKLYPEHIKNLYPENIKNVDKEKDIHILKLSTHLNKYFTRGYPKHQQTYKKVLNIIRHQGNAN